MSSPPNEPLSPLSPPETPDELDVSSPLEQAVEEKDGIGPSSPSHPPRIPHLRTASDSSANAMMTASSTPLGTINAARRPPPQTSNSSLRSGALPTDMQAKMKAFHLSRRGAPAVVTPQGAPGQLPVGGALVGNSSGFNLPPGVRPSGFTASSAPVVPNLKMKPGIGGGLAAKRGLNRGIGMKLSDVTGPPAQPTANGSEPTNNAGAIDKSGQQGSMFSKYSEFVDTATGTLKFKGKAIIHGSGIDFSSGSSFKISLDEVDTIDELGKGNYGTVYQVRHSRPRIRRPGLGLAGNKAPSIASAEKESIPTNNQRNTTGLVMAMKEIRLELDDAKFAAIIMELDILHRCVSPFIVDFYGAFFQEGAVYICMEFMDGGSIDKLYGDGIPEDVLRKITISTIMGLKSLKEDHNIIHRDVKPTNILVNSRGQVKICDFGVSGNLVASIAKTNIGCQSYMAPERIASGGIAQAGANPGGGTYSVQSDIWSLGLSIIECAMGRYPYPPETYNNIFSQLSAIVDGDPPDLPAEGFSDQARDFVRSCLNKTPKLRPTYAMLIRHPWLSPLFQPPTISEDAEAEAEAEAAGLSNIDTTETPDSDASPLPATADKEVAEWAKEAIEKRKLGTLKRSQKPALHAAPLDTIPSPSADS